MSYVYQTERERVFTESGQRLFLKIRDNVDRALASSGAVRSDKAFADCAGDSWLFLACLDRLVELGEIHEITPPSTAGQYRVFVSGRQS